MHCVRLWFHPVINFTAPLKTALHFWLRVLIIETFLSRNVRFAIGCFVQGVRFLGILRLRVGSSRGYIRMRGKERIFYSCNLPRKRNGLGVPGASSMLKGLKVAYPWNAGVNSTCIQFLCVSDYVYVRTCNFFLDLDLKKVQSWYLCSNKTLMSFELNLTV